jgi:hypothetical protein
MALIYIKTKKQILNNLKFELEEEQTKPKVHRSNKTRKIGTEVNEIV